MGLIDGKVAIVTGSGRGIGAATAKKLASEGALVVVSDLDAAPAEETVAFIKNAGGKAIAVVGDVTDPEFPIRLISGTLDAFNGVDIIVNAAGYAWDGMIQNMTDKQWYAMIDVHTTAPFRILREAFVKYIRDAAKKEAAANGVANNRKVVNVTSVSGVYGIAGQTNYSTGKAGIIGMTKALAHEWGRYNINVNAVCFGMIETRMTAPKDQAEKIEREGAAIQMGMPEQMIKAVKMMIPLGRAGTAEEAAGAILFLASPLANFVTSTVLEVTGGGLV